jgi:hypothetical protein
MDGSFVAGKSKFKAFSAPPHSRTARRQIDIEATIISGTERRYRGIPPAGAAERDLVPTLFI